MRRTGVSLLILSLFAVFAAARPGLAASGDYTLRSGDMVEIVVLEDPSLNRQVLVRPDGKISLPLAGTVRAADGTLEQLQRRVRLALRGSFVEPPTVSASLVSLGETAQAEEEDALHYYVVGEVPSPGRFEYDPEKPVDLLQALAMAGGPGVFAARGRIQLRRMDETGIETVTTFDYDSAEDLAAIAVRQPVGDGDVILVPERGLFE